MYEIIFTYHEKNENGKYDTNNSKELRKKITGKKDEDVPLENIAKFIILQFSRRNIWVTGVQIFEYVKKEISFRETDNGIVIKNRKFNLSDNIVVSMEEQETAVPTASPITTQSVATPDDGKYVNIEGKHPHNNGVRRPVDWVVFAPEPQQMLEIKQKSLRFTPEKKYPIFEKQISGIGEVYVMLDDVGREQLVSDKYFVPGNTQLFADKELGFSENQQSRDGGKLYWGGTSGSEMPEIRKR